MTRKICVVLVLLLCLSGCGKKEPTQEALDFRMRLMQAGMCSFTADVTADLGGKVYTFTMQAAYTLEQTTLTVLKPEEIAGISATVTKDGAKVQFDGVELDFGQMANGNVSPVSAPWLLVKCWVGEYISAAGADGDLERVTYLSGYHDEELTVDTWFDREGTPVHAEVVYDGVRCLNIEITDFQL